MDKGGIFMYKTTVKIDGMACGMCESHVCDAIRNAVSVKKVSASHKKGTAEILSEQPVSEAELHRMLDPTGYRVLDVQTAPYEKKGLFRR